MNNIFIFGDSFSFSNDAKSWVNLLREEKKSKLINYSTNAASIFRIYKYIKKHLNEIKKDDLIIINYTNYQRVYINDNYIFETRKKENYLTADLVINDAFSLPFFQKIFFKKFYHSIYDDEQQFETYKLIKKEIRELLKNNIFLEITFFEDDELINFNDIWKKNMGDINHMNVNGNVLVFETILNHI